LRTWRKASISPADAGKYQGYRCAGRIELTNGRLIAGFGH
jgi:hypothetical protein